MNTQCRASRLQLHVEARAQLLDEPQLVQQRAELARHVVPLDRRGLADDARALVGRVAAAEVAHQPRPHSLGLAHVDHVAVGPEHAVHARPVLGARAHERAEAGDAGRRRRWAAYIETVQRWQRAQYTVVRPSIACVSTSVVPQRGQGHSPRPYACEPFDEPRRDRRARRRSRGSSCRASAIDSVRTSTIAVRSRATSTRSARWPRAGGVDPCMPERLVRVDVADAGDPPLILQQLLDGLARAPNNAR